MKVNIAKFTLVNQKKEYLKTLTIFQFFFDFNVLINVILPIMLTL